MQMETTEATLNQEYEKFVKEQRVNHPSHYTWLKDLCGIEVIDITRHMDFDLGNAIKYILRNGKKHEEGYEDIDKAIEDLKRQCGISMIRYKCWTNKKLLNYEWILSRRRSMEAYRRP